MQTPLHPTDNGSPSDWTEAEYLAYLSAERQLYAWVLRELGQWDASRAEAEALAFYGDEAPDAPNRGLVFHDEAWHWAMLRLHGNGYWWTRPGLQTPSLAYCQLSERLRASS